MSTLTSFLESARYDLIDYGTGLEFDNKELVNMLNRMVWVMDSNLINVRSGLLHGQEVLIDCVDDHDYVDLSTMNNGYWDHIRDVWIGSDRKQQISPDQMHYKRTWYTGTGEPGFWAREGDLLLWETNCADSYDTLKINYYKRTRPRLLTFSDTFTANATTDVITLASGNPQLTTGDGPFTVSNSGGSLPTGLAASTNYWVIFDPNDTDGLRLASSKAYAMTEKEYHSGYSLVVGLKYKILERTTLDFTGCGAAANDVGTYFTCSTTGDLSTGDRVLQTNSVDLTATGSGTQTITFSSDMMPYDGRFDNLFREMMVMHAKAKKEGNIGQPESVYAEVFRKRAWEHMIRNKFIPKDYRMDF